jgi:hypothetical protein
MRYAHVLVDWFFKKKKSMNFKKVCFKEKKKYIKEYKNDYS